MYVLAYLSRSDFRCSRRVIAAALSGLIAAGHHHEDRSRTNEQFLYHLSLVVMSSAQR